MTVAARSRHLAVVVALALARPQAKAWAVAEAPLSLDDAVTRALEKNERIVVERESLTAADAGISGAQGAYDLTLQTSAGWQHATRPVNSTFSGAPEGELAPTISEADVSASLSKLLSSGATLSMRASTVRDSTNSSFSLLSPAYGADLGVELRQPLLRGRAIDQARLRVRQAAAERDQARAALKREVANIVAAVERAYWALAAVRLEVGVREEAVRLADDQLGETRIRIEKGIAPESEIAQPQAEFERRRGDLFATRQALSRADAVLKLLILGDDEVAAWNMPLVPTDAIAVDPAPVDAEAAMARALASRAELDEAEAVLAGRKAEADSAADERKPALDLVVSYDRLALRGANNPLATGAAGGPAAIPPDLEGGWGGSLATLFDGPYDDFRAGLDLTVPLGNRAARAAAIAAQSVQHQAEAQLRSQRKAVRAEVLDAVAALETTAQRIAAAVAGSEAAQVQLMAERERYAVGLSTNFLVLTRQNDLSRAGLDEISARADYRRARTELARVTGSILEDRRIDIAPVR